VGFSEFAALTERVRPSSPRGVPLIGFAQAAGPGFFDEAGYPAGTDWDEIAFPGLGDDGVYALEIAGDAWAPVYRDGDRILVSPAIEPRRGDRVVVKTVAGDVLIQELSRATARTLDLLSVTGREPDRCLDRGEVAWIARILWASQ
jgi:phage repressor protein C with HTH and peptisase S24 domain